MKKFVLRHWRGSGQVIADIMKDYYHDYPRHRNIAPFKLSDCIVQVLTQQEYLTRILDYYGVEEHNKMVKKHNLGPWYIIKEATELK